MFIRRVDWSKQDITLRRWEQSLRVKGNLFNIFSNVKNSDFSSKYVYCSDNDNRSDNIII